MTTTNRDEEKRIRGLFEKATDSRNPLLSRSELEEMWKLANDSMHSGAYQVAFMATEAVLCQADRGNVAPDALPDPRKTKCGEGRSEEMIRGFVDRVEGFNRYLRR